jgi:hypothetical protein
MSPLGGRASSSSPHMHRHFGHKTCHLENTRKHTEDGRGGGKVVHHRLPPTSANPCQHLLTLICTKLNGTVKRKTPKNNQNSSIRNKLIKSIIPSLLNWTTDILGFQKNKTRKIYYRRAALMSHVGFADVYCLRVLASPE